MEEVVEKLIRWSEQFKPYKGPFLAAGLTSAVTVFIGFVYDYLYRGLNPLNSAFIIALVIAVIFLACWYQTTEKLYQRLAKKLTMSRFKNPKIAVLSVNGIDEIGTKKLLRSTVYTPEDWYNRLCSNNTAEKTVDLSMKKDYSIILNPFGELYPEEDTTNLKTFKKIKEYVKTGGVFVNTAGLAFYYMWNPKTKIEGLTGPMLETYTGTAITEPIIGSTYKSSISLTPVVLTEDSPLTDTWLYKNFGVRTTLGSMRSLGAKNAAHFDIIDENTIIQEFRSALRCETAEAQLIPIIRSEYLYHPTGRTHECYPIAAVKHGRGYLILVGMVIKKEEDLSLVIKAIKKIIEKLRKEGSLETEQRGNNMKEGEKLGAFETFRKLPLSILSGTIIIVGLLSSVYILKELNPVIAAIPKIIAPTEEKWYNPWECRVLDGIEECKVLITADNADPVKATIKFDIEKKEIEIGD